MDIEERTLKDFQEGRIESLYMQFYPSLLSYARRVLGPEHEFLAEDCVQEAVYKVFQSRRQFDTPLQLRSFLFTCVHNEIITIYRKSDRHERFLTTRKTIEDTLVDEMVMQETLDRLYKAIDELPPELHRIFELSSEQGLRHKEIAEILKLSPHTVKKQKAKLIRTLREHFKDDAPVLIMLAIIWLLP